MTSPVVSMNQPKIKVGDKVLARGEGCYLVGKVTRVHKHVFLIKGSGRRLGGLVEALTQFWPISETILISKSATRQQVQALIGILETQ